jgi:hypothetical protein
MTSSPPGRLYAEARAEIGGLLRRFLAAVGSALDPLAAPSELGRGAHLLAVERGPWEAGDRSTFGRHRSRLVVRQAHPAFDAICDALERELAAERAVLPGFGHTVARHPEFNAVLTDFVERAASPLRVHPRDRLAATGSVRR